MTLSVVIPVLNARAGLEACLQAVAGRADEILVVDGGSTDGSQEVAAALGARLIRSEKGRGRQLAAGAAAASGDRFLFIHADTLLQDNWPAVVEAFRDDGRAGYFRLAFDEDSRPARRTAWLANMRARMLALPYGDQALVLSRELYDTVGGYRPLPLMEDVDIVRRLGRRRLVELPSTATTSAARYQSAGWTRRSIRNLCCLALYFFGVSPERIARFYG